MYINKIQHNWRKDAGFGVSGPVYSYYNLFCFPTPAQIKVDGQIRSTQPNACILYQPKQPRWFCLSEKGAIHWLHAYKDIAPMLQMYEIPLNRVFYPDDPGLVAELFRRLHKEFYSGGRNSDQMADALFEALIIALSRNDVVSGKTAGIGLVCKQRLWELRACVLSQPERKWNVAEMAREVYLSPSRFHAVYKAMFGTTPGQDMIREKMNHAKELLLMDDQMPLSAMAERLGYSSQYHFIRQFKQITGVTPGAYRKNK